MVPWEGYASDETMGTFAPILLYWLYAGAYQLVLHRRPLQRYRLHTTAEEEEKNLVTLPAVVRGVLLQQLVQAIVAMILFMITSDSTTVVVQPSMVVQMFQFLVAMLVMDTWQYFVHRYMHQNKFLYRHIHSQHHRLIVPYAIGALYNHPLEGLLLDTLGGAMSFLVSGMTPRTAVFFFCFAVLTRSTITVDSGYHTTSSSTCSRIIRPIMISTISSKAQNTTTLSHSSQSGTGF